MLFIKRKCKGDSFLFHDYHDYKEFALTILFIIVPLFFHLLSTGCGGGGGGDGKGLTTVNFSGTVTPPQGIAANTLNIVSLNQTATPTNTGTFSIPVKKEGVTTIGAMFPGKEFGYLALINRPRQVSSKRSGDLDQKILQKEEGIIINSQTTAETMVFLSSYLTNSDPAQTEIIMAIIQTDPKVSTLASVIESVSSVPDPMNDPQLQQALTEAVQSVVNTLAQTQSKAAPAKSIPSDPTGKDTAPTKIIQLPLISFHNSNQKAKERYLERPLDLDMTLLTVTASGDNYVIEPQVALGHNVDWLIDFTELDPLQFPNGLVDIGTATNRDVFNRKGNGFNDSSHAVATSYFSFLDVLGTTVDVITTSFLGDSNEQITIPGDSPALYISRAYSGGMADQIEKDTILPQIPDGNSFDNSALATNVVLIATDIVSVAIELPDSFLQCMIDEMINETTPLFAQYLPGGLKSGEFVVITGDVAATGLKSLVPCGYGAGIEGFLGFIAETIIKGSGSIIDIPGKVAAIGEAEQRGIEIVSFATPIESAIIIVGDPFPGTVPSATLTVTKAGTGDGTVTSSPAGINCGADCSEPYNSGTSVTLTATPVTGSIFAGWSGGGCAGTRTCTVTMSAATSVTATFDLLPMMFTLTATKAGTGSGTVTSSPAGINCGQDCTEAYTIGTSVTLTATPAAGSTFAGWSGEGCTGTGTCSITINAATSITVTFTPSVNVGTVQGSVKDFVTGLPVSNVSIVFKDANGIAVGNTTTNTAGNYSIQLPAGRTQGTVSFQGYVLTTIDFEVIANTITTLEIVVLIPANQFPTGDVSGKIDDAVTGNPISGALVEVRSGVNNRTGPVGASTLTDINGLYRLNGLPVGTYTATTSKIGYITNSFTVGVVGGQLTSGQNGTLSPVLATGEVRIILTWGATPSDLDSHLTGPISGQSTRFHVYYANKGSLTSSPFAELDRDDTSSFGPETITIIQHFFGVYRYSVHDFTNRGSTTSFVLSNSIAQVKVFTGSNPTPTIFNVPPNNPGTVWTVFELDGITGNITAVNRFSFESDSGNITSFKPQFHTNFPESLDIFQNLTDK